MSQSSSADILIIGAGIAGASAAYFLRDQADFLILERESQPGYHSTGRSAAQFTETYGNEVIRQLSTLSRPFLEAPPAGFTETSLLTPRGTLFLSPPGEHRHMAHQAVVSLTPAEVGELLPVVREAWREGAFYEAAAMDIDVASLHQGYLRGLRDRIKTNTEVLEIKRLAKGWRLRCNSGDFTARILVNAAGAWCDKIAHMAGLAELGLVPMRRTALTVAAPEGRDVSRWPLCTGGEERFYFKPDAGRLLCSLADETPSQPQDARPEELDIALAAERIQEATSLQIRRIEHSWAGLRSFVADRTPAVGFARDAEDFFWLAGQGGYGIKTSPALGRIAGELIQNPAKESFFAGQIQAARLSPLRLAAV